MTSVCELPVVESVNLAPERLAHRQPTTEEVLSRLDTIGQNKVDVLRVALEKQPQVNCPTVHRFTPGLYTREIFMPRDTFVISKIHKTEHPFFVTRGRVSVWIEGQGVVVIEGPYVGITKAGTRRVLYTHSDCIWLTCHPTTKLTVDEVEQEIILKPNDVEVLPMVGNDILLQLKEAK